MYLDTGLIIPPFTFLKEFIDYPFFQDYIKFKNYEIKFDLFSEYKHKPFQSHKEFHKEIKKILNSFILRYKSKKIVFSVISGIILHIYYIKHHYSQKINQ